MAWNLVGDWQGTMFTDGLFSFPGIGKTGGPPLTQNVLFRITDQEEHQYVNRAIGQSYGGYSSIAGQLSGADTDRYDTIIGGMVDARRQVELTFFFPPPSSGIPSQCIYFAGYLSVAWPHGQIYGKWTLVELDDVRNGIVVSQVGNLSVSKILPIPLSPFAEAVRKIRLLGG